MFLMTEQEWNPYQPAGTKALPCLSEKTETEFLYHIIQYHIIYSLL